MAANGEPPSSSSPLKSSSSTAPPPSRPTITLPPRPFPEAIFNGGSVSGGMGVAFSPGPMTLVSNFFADSDDFKSFSQLLAGAMASPGTIPPPRLNFQPPEITSAGDTTSGDGDFQFKQSRGHGLTIAPPPAMFAVPTGWSAATLLDSPGLGLFSPAQGPFGMTHQQALAQVTAQAAQAQSHLDAQPENTSSFSSAAATSLTQFPSFYANPPNQQQIATIAPDSRVTAKESSDLSQPDQRSQTSSVAVDRPADDGYNWRKYGQKQVKGSEFPRSYYKCTYPNCPVKKKVERSLDGQVTEIIYKGQHNHKPPEHNKRSKDSGSFNGSSNNQGNSELPSKFQSENVNKLKDRVPTYVISSKDQESSQATPGHQSGTSDSEEVEEVDDTETGADENGKDEPDLKRRNTEVRISSHRTVTEPRIIVQTTSEVDLLDDGYRWRKYGQKVVKGNPYPRSYYKCTTQGCNVRKHVERAASDPKAVVTTYEGKHIHDVPAAKSSSHNTANSNAYQSKRQDHVQERRALFNKAGSANGNKQPIARLRLKEEQIT